MLGGANFCGSFSLVNNVCGHYHESPLKSTFLLSPSNLTSMIFISCNTINKTQMLIRCCICKIRFDFDRTDGIRKFSLDMLPPILIIFYFKNVIFNHVICISYILYESWYSKRHSSIFFGELRLLRIQLYIYFLLYNDRIMMKMYWEVRIIRLSWIEYSSMRRRHETSVHAVDTFISNLSYNDHDFGSRPCRGFYEQSNKMFWWKLHVSPHLRCL